MSMLHMSYTDKNGSTHVQWHSCWNVDLFVKAQKASHAAEGGIAEVITEATYREVKRRERHAQL